MAIGVPWVGTVVQGNVAGTNVTTVTVDVSAATNGQVVFIIGTLSDAQSGALATPSGWTALGQTSEGTTGAASSRTAIFWKIKASTDTTVVFSWTVSCKPQFVGISWPGVNTTTPTEGLAWLVHVAQSNTSYPTATATPTSADRWAVGVFSSRGSTASAAWTPDATQTSRAAAINTTTPFVGLLVADTGAAVTQAAHTYTATGQSASHGQGGLFFLIPAAGGTSTVLGRPTEVDTAVAFGVAKALTAGRPAEVDAAKGLVAAKTVTLGRAAETNTARSLAAAKTRVLGRATEADSATGLTPAKAPVFAPATETDAARTLILAATVGLDPASEADAARQLIITIGSFKLLPLDRADETDTARELAIGTRVPLGLATETDTARTLRRGVHRVEAATLVARGNDTTARVRAIGTEASARGRGTTATARDDQVIATARSNP